MTDDHNYTKKCVQQEVEVTTDFFDQCCPPETATIQGKRQHSTLYLDKDGYAYIQNTTTRHRRQLLCQMYKPTGCKARASMCLTPNSPVILKPSTAHNHPPNQNLTEDIDFDSVLRKRAKEENMSLRNIYNEEAERFPDAALRLPYRVALQRMARSRRSSMNDFNQDRKKYCMKEVVDPIVLEQDTNSVNLGYTSAKAPIIQIKLAHKINMIGDKPLPRQVKFWKVSTASENEGSINKDLDTKLAKKERPYVLYMDDKGYAYVQNSTTRNKRQLRCQFYHSKKCRAWACMSLHNPNAPVIPNQYAPHNHQPNPYLLEDVQFDSCLKLRAVEENTPFDVIYNEESERFPRAASHIPYRAALQRMRRSRRLTKLNTASNTIKYEHSNYKVTQANTQVTPITQKNILSKEKRKKNLPEENIMPIFKIVSEQDDIFIETNCSNVESRRELPSNQEKNSFISFTPVTTTPKLVMPVLNRIPEVRKTKETLKIMDSTAEQTPILHSYCKGYNDNVNIIQNSSEVSSSGNTIIKGRRQHSTLYLDNNGYAYTLNSVSRNKKQLRCQLYKQKKCRAWASMSINSPNAPVIPKHVFSHNHPPDKGLLEDIEFDNVLRQRAAEENVSLRVIYDNEATRFPCASVRLPFKIAFQRMARSRKSQKMHITTIIENDKTGLIENEFYYEVGDCTTEE